MSVLAAPAIASKSASPSLRALRARLWDKPAGSVAKLAGYRVKITDGPNAYMQYKDVFVRGIYRFACERPDPLIIDGGGNMGISVLGFKQDHPDSRIVAFEPDPQIFELLQSNLQQNDVQPNVRLVMSGLGAEDGSAVFEADGSAGGRVTGSAGKTTVTIERLSPYLAEPVDFLKLNIEGQELAVLRECAAAGVLRNVHRMVVEYHSWAGAPQELGDLLNLLADQGFRYLIHDFDAETCSITKPPFKHRPQAHWFCLVHAQRL